MKFQYAIGRYLWILDDMKFNRLLTPHYIFGKLLEFLPLPLLLRLFFRKSFRSLRITICLWCQIVLNIGSNGHTIIIVCRPHGIYFSVCLLKLTPRDIITFQSLSRFCFGYSLPDEPRTSRPNCVRKSRLSVIMRQRFRTDLKDCKFRHHDFLGVFFFILCSSLCTVYKYNTYLSNRYLYPFIFLSSESCDLLKLW